MVEGVPYLFKRLTFHEAGEYVADLSLTTGTATSAPPDWDRLDDRPELDADPFTRRIVLTELGAEALVCRWRIRRPGLLHVMARRWWYVVSHVSRPFGHRRFWVSTSRREAQIRFDTVATRVTPHLADIPLVAAQWRLGPGEGGHR